MTSRKSKQMITGKAFEYALLTQFQEKLKGITQVSIISNSALGVANDCFNLTSYKEKSEYLLSASFAVNFLMDLEPRLSNDLGKNDILQLEILSDDFGKAGDVRDVLAIRALQKREIGVSAKNNHSAVKHSRLSRSIDFGKKWLGEKCSQEYFDTIIPIFDRLDKIRSESNKQRKWSELGDYHSTVYVPILQAFVNELRQLYNKNPITVSQNLISYLVGNKDFYKIIKSKKTIEIHAFNLYGTLNRSFGKILPKFETPHIKLPTQIMNISFKKASKTTVIVDLNHDWSLSFRIHNASSRVEPSLKFDINLLKSPKQLFKNVLYFN